MLGFCLVVFLWVFICLFCHVWFGLGSFGGKVEGNGGPGLLFCFLKTARFSFRPWIFPLQVH